MLFMLVLFAVCATVWLISYVLRARTSKLTNSKLRAARLARETAVNNFVTRLFLVAFFELLICGFLNASSMSGPGGGFWQVMSLVAIATCFAAIIYTASMLVRKGPYLSNTYVEKSLLGSFWGVRPLRVDLILVSETKTEKNEKNKVQDAELVI